DLALYFSEPNAPMAMIPLALPPFRVINPRQRSLPRIKALFSLCDAVALRFEQPGKVARLAIAASHQVTGDFCTPLLGSPPQVGFEILRVPSGQEPNPGDGCPRRPARIPQRLLQLLDRRLFAANAERRQAPSVPIGLAPDRRRRNDLLMQPRGAGAVKR